MTPSPSAIELKHVARRFVTPSGELLSALEDFDLTIAPGEFMAIVGPTGCGKSTTLGLIAGLARPQAGEVTLFDKKVSGVDRRVGFVFQQDAVFPWRDVLHNVMAGPLFRGIAKDKAEAEARDWIIRVGLKGFEGHHPHQLSGGMRKRVALAQTFINNPQVLLMDEPFSALDVQTRELMQEELLQLWAQAKSAVLFVTHDLDEAILLADRVAVLTTRPARVKSVHTIDLPRPRDVATLRYDERFIAIARKINDDLREEVLRARAGH
ncbi:ABC transporter ATP-binding protein [Tardiphaga sp. vice352]|uniref:ABC transporter ATP-binding protein n=1 Tax=unclassified Tardiphaga TaxID=2631404 RepID=UPI001162DB31|nr:MULTISPECIES: ABC transporter ATP-binding protein [unclassified Tardiphaga]MBC7584997.1 ABC transporter ATP-binding protein [Tardiphaga sp.]QDM16270.1 ABC transporter ATP-binding protein [Tardiphaga sp. vice278]QDM21294.1 ABC transporter ATP-binding protein [Tardiphaga sp. vice154]QDM26479.1 ABC transporter ATP-binding protein [Tardiphaga sp. vice304]QDM31545.1 ABC transporter ATP-binding protein [Tardiphaga sp. vice352]